MVDDAQAHNLPSPQSESGYAHSPANKPRTLSMTPATDANHDPSSADESSVLGGQSSRRTADLPRNDQGKIVCKHPHASAACSNLTFDRKCEWSKHMDKHDRPYLCEEPGCEKLRGFTYSGGLLRHKREVHKMHGGPKETLMCPYPYCKRSTGHGFTRRENLNEHIRRVHRPAPDIADGEKGTSGSVSVYDTPLPFDNTASPASAIGAYTGTRRPRKRKQPDSPATTEGATGEASTAADQIELREEIKRLRRDAEQKDMRILKLEADISTLLAQRDHQPTQSQPQPPSQQQQQPSSSSTTEVQIQGQPEASASTTTGT